MNTLTSTFAAVLMLGGLGLTAASAAPAMPAASVLSDGVAVTDVAYGRRHRMRHRGMRRMQSRTMSDPNSRNPSQPGYQQQKGNTSGGPRY